jgi:valyl-tRNA synthetase
MPFITEELWQKLRVNGQSGKPAGSIMTAPWPHVQEAMVDKKTESKMNLVFEVVAGVRNMRSELEIPLQDKIDLTLCVPSKEKHKFFQDMSASVISLSGLKGLEVKQDYLHSSGQISSVVKDMHLVIPVSGMTDPAKFMQKIGERVLRVKGEIASKEKILQNDNFVKRAPEEIVQKEKEKLAELKLTLKKLEAVKYGT